MTSALDYDRGVERNRLPFARCNDNPHGPYARFRKRNTINAPRPIALFNCVAFELSAAGTRWFEYQPYIFCRETGEVLAHHAYGNLSGPRAARVDGHVGHGFRRMDVHESGIRWDIRRRRMYMRGRRQGPEDSDEQPARVTMAAKRPILSATSRP